VLYPQNGDRVATYDVTVTTACVAVCNVRRVLLACVVLAVLASVLVYGVMSYKYRGISCIRQVAAPAAADAGDDVTLAATTAAVTVAVLEWAYYVAAAGAGT